METASTSTMRELHLFFIAGENSSDIHSSNMLKALHRFYPKIKAVGLGGPHMQAAGMELRYSMVDELAIMGLAGVIKNFPKIKKVFQETEEYLKRNRPDALILVDYPGFNIRMAERAKRLGIPVIWYISPQIWAWHKERIHTLARVVDLMIVIFPFEVQLYRAKNVNVQYVGHPLFDLIKIDQSKEEVYAQYGLDPNKPLITIVPGSRKREVHDFLNIMLNGARRYREKHPDAQFAIIRATTIDKEIIQKFIDNHNLPFDVAIVDRCRFNLRQHADFSWVKSGTSTLEAAIIGAPHLIVYKVNWLTWVIGKQLFTISFIGLPNIVAGSMIVPELLQDEFTPLNLAEQTAFYLDNPDEYNLMVQDLGRVKERLGGPGASAKTARAVLSMFNIHPPEEEDETVPTSDQKNPNLIESASNFDAKEM
jgi:lipid-A-disaccharide synthase